MCWFSESDRNWFPQDPQKALEKLRGLISGEVATSSRKIGDLVELYLSSIKHTQSKDTTNAKEYTYRSFLAVIDADTRVHSITSAMIEKFLRHYKKATARTYQVRLSALFEWTTEKGILQKNPVKGAATIKRRDDPVPDYLTDDEIETLLDLTTTQRYPTLQARDRLVFLLMLYAGLRRKEVCHLKWSDVDFKRRILVVRNGKGGKHRMVGIGDILLQGLLWIPRTSAYVITTRSGNPLARNTLSRIAEKYVDRLNCHYKGRKRFSLHSLRATCATKLCEKGVSTRVVQQLLGHEDPRTTLRYAAVTEKAVHQAAALLG